MDKHCHFILFCNSTKTRSKMQGVRCKLDDWTSGADTQTTLQRWGEFPSLKQYFRGRNCPVMCHCIWVCKCSKSHMWVSWGNWAVTTLEKQEQREQLNDTGTKQKPLGKGWSRRVTYKDSIVAQDLGNRRSQTSTSQSSYKPIFPPFFTSSAKQG